MGSLRTFLAITVVFGHSYGFIFVGGPLAVQLFYIISGFLISYILTESNNYSSIKKFYINRFLRLFPIYWIVAIFTLLTILFSHYFFNVDHPLLGIYSDIDAVGRTALTLSNFFLFGQDWILFTGVKDGVFQFVSTVRDTDMYVWRGLLVPQAWTLGVEISFYLVAPFLLKRRKLLLVVLAASLLTRLVLILNGIGLQDPWTYRFFPTELALFLFGALSHQVWMPYLKSRGLLTARSSQIATALILFYCTIYFLLPFRSVNTVLLIAVFVVSLPFQFAMQNQNRWDRVIGELSYPIYITHMIIIWLFERFADQYLSLGPRSLTGAVIITIITVLVSIGLNAWVVTGINEVRRRVRGSRAGSTPSDAPRPEAGH